MTRTKLFLFCLTFFCSILLAAQGPRYQIGPPASILGRLPKTSLPSGFSLPSASGDQILLDIRDYYYVDGQLSMTGRVPGSDSSTFILKGNSKRLKGWIVLRDQNTAFLYNTDESGSVYAEEAAVTDIYPVCDLNTTEKSGGMPSLKETQLEGAELHLKPYDGEDLYKLESLPGVGKILWLDIRRVMNGDTPKYITKEEMFKTWQLFAATFSMFEVNVTTDESVYNSVSVNNSGMNRFLDETGTSNCCVDCFGTSEPCYTRVGNNEPENHYIYGKTAAHETGHMMGLHHDGDPGGEYFSGLSDFQWSPIMGNNLCCTRWDEHLHQWSKGEYRNANQRQDNLAIISREFSYRKDDIPGSTPLNIGVTGEVEPLLNRGQINSSSDSDIFTFQIVTSGGHASLSIEKTELRGGSALDIEVQIVEVLSDRVVARDNPVKSRSAALEVDLPIGSYHLVIKGGAEGTPSNGFSNYASMGFYAVSGNIMGAGAINNSVSVSDEGTICRGQSAMLSAHQDPAYSYQWYKDSSPINGATLPTLEILEQGTYHVVVSDDEYQVNSAPVALTVLDAPDPPTYSLECPGPGRVSVNASGAGNVFDWYATATGGEVIHTGPSFQADAGPGTSYFVSTKIEHEILSVGPKDNTIGTGGYHAGDYYLVFDSEEDVEIISGMVNAQGRKTRKFTLYDSNNELLDSLELMLPDGESKVTLNFEVPAGTGYQIGIDKINDENIDMYRNDNGVNYPYSLAGLVSITGSTANDGDFYYYLYDWEVRKMSPCSSPRTEVKAEFCTDVVNLNPGHSIAVQTMAGDKIRLQYPEKARVENISLTSIRGSLMFGIPHQTPFLDISGYEPGVYILRIKAGRYGVERKIIKF